MISRRTLLALPLMTLAALAGWSVPLRAQEAPGPEVSPKAPDIMRLPTEPGRPTAPSDQPPVPPEEIIRRFSAHEDELARLFTTYGYHKTVRLEEIGSDGKVAGMAEIGASVPTSQGARSPSGEMQSTLRFLNLQRDNIEALSKIPAFPLVSSNLAQYEISYAGKQPVDELSTYVFQIKPRQLERARAYFDGLIWVDDHDLAIVKSYGKWVTEVGDVQPSRDLPFAIFETYRQPVDNKYWMPAYSRSDGTYDNKGSAVPVRLIIRWDHYAPLPANTSSTQAQPDPAR